MINKKIISLILFAFVLQFALIMILMSQVSAQVEAIGLEEMNLTSLGSIDAYLAVGSIDNGVFLRNTTTEDDTGWANLGLKGMHITNVYPHIKSVGPLYELHIGISVRPTLPDTVLLYSWDGDSMIPHDNGIDEVIVSMDGFPREMSIGGEIFAGGGSSIYRNAFGATDWEKVYLAPEGGSIKAVKADIDNEWVFAGGSINDPPSTVVLFSDDKGDTWQDISPESNFGVINSIEIVTGDIVSIYGVSSAGIIKTSNFGESWDLLYQNDIKFVSNIVADPENGNILYASGADGIDSSSSVLIRTVDRGSSWEQINGLKTGGVLGLTFVSLPSLGSYLYFVVSFGQGVFRLPHVLTGIDGLEDVFPINFKIEQNYPNPFNSITTLQYDLQITTHVKIIVYNILGEEIKILVDKMQLSGKHEIFWDGRNHSGNNVTSGLYFFRFATNDFVQTIKTILLR